MQSYFDLQLNGYGGVSFAGDDLTADDLHACCETLRADDVGGVLGLQVRVQQRHVRFPGPIHQEPPGAHAGQEHRDHQDPLHEAHVSPGLNDALKGVGHGSSPVSGFV